MSRNHTPFIGSTKNFIDTWAKGLMHRVTGMEDRAVSNLAIAV